MDNQFTQTIDKATERTKQQNITPTAIKNRHFGNIIQLGSLITQTATLSNGQQTTFSITTTSQGNSRNLSIPDITLYVGSVATNNRLPGGSNVTASQWQVVFMGNDWLLNDGKNTVTQVFVRNISAGASQTVIMQAKRRSLSPTTIS